MITQGKKSKKKIDSIEPKDILPSVSIKKLLTDISDPTEKFLLILGILGSLATGIIMPFCNLLTGRIINKFNSNQLQTIKNSTLQVSGLYENVNKMAADFVYVGIGIFFCRFFMILCLSLFSRRLLARIRVMYFEKLLLQEQGFFDERNAFEFTTKIQTQIKIIEIGIKEKFGNALQSFVYFVTAVIISFATSWEMTLAVCVIIPFIAISGYLLTKKIQESNELSQKSYEKAGGIAEEVLYNLKTVNSFCNYEYELNRYDELISNSMKICIQNGFNIGIVLGLSNLFFLATYCITFWYGGYLISNKSINTNSGEPFQVGDIFTILISIINGSGYLGQSAPNFIVVLNACDAAREFFWLIKRKPLTRLEKSIKTPSKENLKGKIIFKDVSFSYPSNPSKLILKNVTFEFEEGKKTAIVGKSGSGKSTIINLIERFYPTNNGKIYLDEHDIEEIDIKHYRSLVGYVSQEPILFDLSIKDNIVFGRENLSELQIESAIKKSYSIDFIEKFPEGYNCQVGVRGSKLSGGQKQRISIARAIVDSPKILILDEATSALDNKSEKIVQKALDEVSNSVTTIIIAHRFSTIKNADKIIVLDEGEIKEQGTHLELMELNGIYKELVKNQINDMPVDIYSRQSSISKKILRRNENEKFEELQLLTDGSTKEFDDRRRFENDEKILKKVKKRVFSYLSEYKLFIFFAVFSTSISGVFSPINGALEGIVAQKMVYPVDEIYNNGRFYSLIFLILAFGYGISTFYQNYSLIKIGEILTKKMRFSCFKKFLSLQNDYYDEAIHNPGNLVSRLSTDSANINGVTVSMFAIFFQVIITLGLGLILGFYYDYRIALISLSFIPLVTMNSIYFKKMQENSSLSSEQENILGEILSECLVNTRTIFSYNFQPHVLEYYSKVVEKINSSYKAIIMTSLLYGFSQFIVFALNATVFYSGGRFCSEGTLTFGDLLSSAFSIYLSAVAIGTAQQYIGDYERCKQSLINLGHVLDQKSNIDPFEKTESKLKIKIDNFVGKIEFDKVFFSYPSRKNQLVLHDVSFTINPGQFVAFVGESGGGKSTIIQLILRFYDVDEGRILIDGIDIRQYDLISYRKCISLVMQEPVLFKTSLNNNIKYGKLDATQEEITEAAKKSFIEHLIDKNEENQIVSGGEKQRIAIARALIKNPKILLLDEATSALDKTSEEMVQKALDQVARQRTTIAVAHRLSTIKNCDVIFVLDCGEISEKGTHEELLQLKKNYHRLFYQSNKI